MQIGENVIGFRTFIANIAYISGLGEDKSDWVLVDTGIPFSSSLVLNNTQKLFGSKKPLAIILTHAHFDHIGALETLIKLWNVPIYLHEQEVPYLLGEKRYPAARPFEVKGIMSFLSPFYPRDGIDLKPKIVSLSSKTTIPFLKGWKWIHTPGHTCGHISLFREEDGLLLAGDALTTVKQESLFSVITQKKEIHSPPAYFTPDRATALKSIEKLIKLNPKILYTGHGKPLYGNSIVSGMEKIIKRADKEAPNVNLQT
ncbi:MBL fold metallo-hydrolase [Bacillus sp. B1-b2]|uniref:MBL fold metallo-hydrolase n=1 Tax=Bacillus sp. B1-b2 TaxID=2653201 RepID=UPI0012627F61|nr:MBL fold metallo-hydrolase [Bacillus sp. B1-b2]KAB7671203.1 MBL fold metallo-hydrolase [Bacillus sp. B1-b2]